MLTPRETYALIEQTIRRFQFPRMVRYLCTLARVSRSGYYAWLYQTDKQLEKEHIVKTTQEHKTCPNLLKRQFNQEDPEKGMLTDITYLFYGQGKKAYLSCVKDSTTREILAYHVSSSLQMDIVYQTLDNLKERLREVIHPQALLHSTKVFIIHILNFRNV
ncbi:hypothetical protein [Bacillus sp. BPN334]|uniref:hypothetical protein n=1 Tax=Bacillus sp. BPN334 TaxID=2217815 RepID=UPI00351A6828